MGTGLISPVHIMILGIVALLLFGAKRLPEIGRSLGTGMREFKISVTGEDETPTPPPALPTTNTTLTPSVTHEAEVTEKV